MTDQFYIVPGSDERGYAEVRRETEQAGGQIVCHVYGYAFATTREWREAVDAIVSALNKNEAK
jgi:hypothetical protein